MTGGFPSASSSRSRLRCGAVASRSRAYRPRRSRAPSRCSPRTTCSNSPSKCPARCRPAAAHRLIIRTRAQCYDSNNDGEMTDAEFRVRRAHLSLHPSQRAAQAMVLNVKAAELSAADRRRPRNNEFEAVADQALKCAAQPPALLRSRLIPRRRAQVLQGEEGDSAAGLCASERQDA
jgi:hypothetical protein